MVTVKEAVLKATEFAHRVFEPQQLTGLLLEEIDTVGTGAESVWLITLSMPTPKPYALPAPDLWGALGSARTYKTFAVSRENGEVLSMKIRELASAE